MSTSPQTAVASGPAPAKTIDPAWTPPDEAACIARLKEIRWTNGPYCPYCGHHKIYGLNTTRLPICGACKSTFSVKVGTIFHGSPLPLAKWFTAIRLVTDPERTVTSAHMAEVLRVGQTTAWQMLRRLRHAAATPSFNRRLRIGAGRRAVRPRPQPPATKSDASVYVTKFKINLSFEEALERFAGVERRELQASLTSPSRKRMPTRARPAPVPPAGDGRPTP
jgi:transposase-like protein